MASKFINIADTWIRKTAITHFSKKPTSEVEGKSSSDTKNFPYSLCIGICGYKLTLSYTDEKDRDVDFDALVKMLEEEADVPATRTIRNNKMCPFKEKSGKNYVNLVGYAKCKQCQYFVRDNEDGTIECCHP